MDNDYRLTSSEYAKILGISTEALRSRRRRGLETSFKKDIHGNFWWKNDRPNAVAVNENNRPLKNGLFRVPGSKKIDTRKRRRGVHAKGEETNYHNARNGWQLEELNLTRQFLKLDSGLKKHGFTDEELEEITKTAKDKILKKKEAKLKKSMEETLDEIPGTPINAHGTPNVDPKYGQMLKGKDMAQVERNQSRRYDRLDEEKHKTKFIEKETTDFFGLKHTYKIPDFYSRSDVYVNPYGEGLFESNLKRGEVEVDIGYRSSLPNNQYGMVKPRNFKSKIDEAIWDAEQRLKKNK